MGNRHKTGTEAELELEGVHRSWWELTHTLLTSKTKPPKIHFKEAKMPGEGTKSIFTGMHNRILDEQNYRGRKLIHKICL